jgi:hypothetical protein
MDEIIKYQDTKIAGKEDVDLYLASEYINTKNPIPTIYIKGADYPLQFYQTRETLSDMDRYKSFIDNCVRRFRRSRTYKAYKAYLMSMGLDRCQINGNIQDGMADIEMHHNFLTIFDITTLISQHVLNTVGRCTTFDIICLLAEEHKANHIPIVMLSETAHQLYHNDPEFYIGQDQCFGDWVSLLAKYRYGITIHIAQQVIKYIQNSQKHNELNTLQYYQLQDHMMSWGSWNEYNYYNSNYFNATAIDRSSGYVNTNYYEINTVDPSTNKQAGNQETERRVYSEDELFSQGI